MTLPWLTKHKGKSLQPGRRRNEFQQQKPWLPGDSYVYFVQSGETGPIKIGVSKDLSGRLSTLQTDSPYELKLLIAIPGECCLERKIHQQLSHYRIRGEWFSSSTELLALINELVEEAIQLEAQINELRERTKRWNTQVQEGIL